MAEPIVNTDYFPFQKDICGWVEFGLKSIKSMLKTHGWLNEAEYVTLGCMNPCISATQEVWMLHVTLSLENCCSSWWSSSYTWQWYCRAEGIHSLLQFLEWNLKSDNVKLWLPLAQAGKRTVKSEFSSPQIHILQIQTYTVCASTHTKTQTEKSIHVHK